MQAIKTRYLGPTDYRGARIKASAQAGSVTISYDYALNSDANHKAAAQALIDRLDWCFTFSSGVLPCGDWCHVLSSPFNKDA